MINSWIILWILFLHWIADFVCQTDKMALGKSKNWNDLLNHTFTYTIIMAIGIFPVFATISTPICWFLFLSNTFLIHTVQDYITSRENCKLLERYTSKHNFFVLVGFDQFLHFAQLLLTYYFLTK